MRIEHIVDSDTKARLGVSVKDKGNVHPKTNKPKKRKQERLSERDWLEIMGTNRDTYTRKNGAIRRK
ncbi:hypothetical protein D1B33_07515 [Lysinibacillus yapensis]|uniref:Uncharacterized protein n=1 Tax=Ureibacillus yapensis TaxID=2304605 RepID=A0A396SC84_9BACL|nr:hypothetical protein [Lysinibacillus yapensis]RHW38712.1 hypothetical protein D1B33_07515 [Lysinibacillus yapensis]